MDHTQIQPNPVRCNSQSQDWGTTPNSNSSPPGNLMDSLALTNILDVRIFIYISVHGTSFTSFLLYFQWEWWSLRFSQVLALDCSYSPPGWFLNEMLGSPSLRALQTVMWYTGKQYLFLLAEVGWVWLRRGTSISGSWPCLGSSSSWLYLPIASPGRTSLEWIKYQASVVVNINLWYFVRYFIN